MGLTDRFSGLGDLIFSAVDASWPGNNGGWSVGDGYPKDEGERRYRVKTYKGEADVYARSRPEAADRGIWATNGNRSGAGIPLRVEQIGGRGCDCGYC
jgi:hypothetical protein